MGGRMVRLLAEQKGKKDKGKGEKKEILRAVE